MLSQIASFFETVDGILSLDPYVILGAQTAPNGLTVAIVILLLATVSDVIGNSPVLFINRMSPGRLAAAMGVEAILSLARLAIWLCCSAILLAIVNDGSVTLASVVLVIGLGYAPMLWSFLVLIPTAGPFIRRVLVAWTLVTITASIAVASSLSPWQVLTAPVIAALLIVILYRSSNVLSAGLLGALARRWLGVDLMRRTRAIDPYLVMAASKRDAGRSVSSA